MTISGGSALPKDEIDRMIKEAEAHAAEDAKRREEVEVRNQAEQLVYAIQKQLKDNEDKVPADVATEVNDVISEVNSALGGTDVEAVKTATTKLTEVAQKIGQAVYAAEQAAGEAASASADAGAAPVEDDVVDAEVVDEEDETK